MRSSTVIAFTLLILANALLFHFVLWRRMRPMLKIAKKHRDDEPKSYKFVAFDLIALTLFIGLMLSLTYGWYSLLESIGTEISPRPGTLIEANPDRAMWMLPALLLSSLSTGFILDLIMRMIVGRRYQEYITASHRRSHGTRYYWPGLLPWFNWGSSSLSLVFVVLTADFYTHFKNDSITINDFVGIGERSESYSDITEIARVAKTKAPNGNIKNQPYVAIQFKDGTVWKSRSVIRTPLPQQDNAIIELLIAKTGLKPTSHDLLP